MSRHSLRGPQWRRLLRGVWAPADLPDTRELRLSALRLVLPPQAVLRGLTAAWLYGADVRRADDLDVHVYVPPPRHVRGRDGLLVLETALCAEDVWWVADMLVTSPTRTVFDCLRRLPETEAIVVADALTHLRRTTIEEIDAYISLQRGVRNCRVAATRLELVEPKTESPMETRLRLLLLRAGLPCPQPQWEVRDDMGKFVARLDFAWPAQRAAIEYDGAESQMTTTQRRARSSRWWPKPFGGKIYPSVSSSPTATNASCNASRQCGIAGSAASSHRRLDSTE
jgi:hypothetical protein